MGLRYKYIEVNMMDLVLDPQNPRFASSELVKKSGSISQEIIIKHLLTYAKVSNLACRINNLKELHGADLVTCYEENGKYIVLEGNRRVCACKLLLDNTLIPNEYKSEFPVTNENTKNNIKRILVSLYTDRESVQAYLSDRHIKGIEKWSAFEKQNYYMNLFSEFKDLNEVAKFTPDSVSKIKKSIIKYQFFMDVFNSIKSKYTNISIEKMDYLPLVNRFMSVLVGNDSEVGLKLDFDENKLRYYCDDAKSVLYNRILLLIGEAFLLRKEKSKCEPGEFTKIVSTELNTIQDQKNIIINDIRIPGLFKLIKEYNGVLDGGSISKVESHEGDGVDKEHTSIKENTNEESLDSNENAKENVKEELLNNNSNERDGDEEKAVNNNDNKKERDEEKAVNNNDDGKEDAKEELLNNSNEKESNEEKILNNNDGEKEDTKEETLNSNGEQQTINQNPGFRPQKTPKKFLNFTEEEYRKFKIHGNTNYELKIKSVIYDLSTFPVHKHPYTCALLYRTLLESTGKLIFERYKNNVSFKYVEDRLVDNLIYLNDNFLFNNTKNKDTPKMRKAIKRSLTTNNIIDILNLYIHYGYPVDVTNLLESWNTMKLFIAACLER